MCSQIAKLPKKHNPGKWGMMNTSNANQDNSCRWFRNRNTFAKAPSSDSQLDTNKTVALSSNSTWLLVGSWLFSIQHLPCSVSLCCMLGGSVEVWMHNILHQPIESQTHFWHAKRCQNVFVPQTNRNRLLVVQIQTPPQCPKSNCFHVVIVQFFFICQGIFYTFL